MKWPPCVQIDFRLLYYDDYRSSNTSVYHVLLSYGLQKQFLLDPLLLAMQKKKVYKQLRCLAKTVTKQ